MQASIVSQIFLPTALAIIMLAVGLSLSMRDFAQVLREPRTLLLGIGAQMLLLPLLGLIVVTLFQLPPVLAVGIMILTFAPGGATSNAITLLARGDAALSVSLTALVTLLTPFTIPLLTALALQHWFQTTAVIDFPIIESIMKMVMITLLPVLVGVGFSARFPVLAARIRVPFRRFSLCLLLLMVVLLVRGNWHLLPALLVQLAPAVFCLVLAAMLLGFLLAKMAGLNDPQRISIMVEVGLQNAGTALLVTSTILQNAEMSASALVYGVLMQIPAFALIGWRNRRALLLFRRSRAA
ncbi:bile acid:sodium symporter family protein [Nitrincola alkalilacustris]|uniref:bile acid:sodium symporter family protein n=1 Tax=Nitrincola alkalilacustris TaxID=1571224 RepID=UPI00124D83E7|nr:bile acid:sodium symporter [Nitrincola alkalilacustris]